ncbi:MAG: hypothetical protein WCB04_04290 [Mycobacteriales bacterium]
MGGGAAAGDLVGGGVGERVGSGTPAVGDVLACGADEVDCTGPGVGDDDDVPVGDAVGEADGCLRLPAAPAALELRMPVTTPVTEPRIAPTSSAVAIIGAAREDAEGS